MQKCKSCDFDFEGDFCNNCGNPRVIERIDKTHILEEFDDYFLHLEKGILFTLRELFLRPGITINNFLAGNRNKYYKPIPFLVLFSGIYVYIDHTLGYHPSELVDSAQTTVNSFMREHLIYFSLFQILIMIFVLKNLLYRKVNYNIYEYFFAMAYSSGMTILFSTVGIIITYVTNVEVIQYFISIIGLIYGVWLLGQFMGSNTYKGYIKSALAKMLSLFIFLILSSLIFTLLNIFEVNY